VELYILLSILFKFLIFIFISGYFIYEITI